MVTNKKKMNVTSVHLSDYEMNTLKDAAGTLNLLFCKLTAKSNISHIANIITGLEELLEELKENNNSILEFSEEE